MFRLKALNESSEGESDDDERVTKEAEETIIVNEYMRALQLKAAGKKDEALSLFSELLDADAVVKVPQEEKDTNKLFQVRYNCYRNVGLLYEELGNHEEALRNLIQAIETDNTDIYTLNKVGKLALTMDQPALAQRIYERCQDLNPNHWPSINGLLDALVQSNSYGAAYGWAIHCLQRNPKHQKALQVFMEIRKEYPEALSFLEKTHQDVHESQSSGVTCTSKLFTTKSLSEEPVEHEEQIDFESLKMEKIDWIVLGKFIRGFHDTLMSSNMTDLTASYSLDKFIRAPPDAMPFIEGLSDLSPDEPSKEPMMMDEAPVTNDAHIQPPLPVESPPPLPPLPPASLTEDEEMPDVIIVSEGNTDNESKPAEMPVDGSVAALKEDNKRRRRGSDLSMLEQWGWHKSRRSKRKKVDDEVENVDTTMNGFLRRILSTHFLENFDEPALRAPSRDEKMSYQPAKQTIDEFQESTRDVFDELLAKLKVSFDLIEIVTKFCQALGQLWQQYIPLEVRVVFQDIYELYLSLGDSSLFNLMPCDDQLACMTTTLLYLEICLTSDAIETKTFHKICSVLRFYVASCRDEDTYVELAGRLLWLYVCFNLNRNHFETSLEHLENLKAVFDDYPQRTMYLPNLEKYNHFNYDLIMLNIRQTKGKISLRNTKMLYAEEKYEELVDILELSLLQSDDVPNETLVLSYCGQIQLFLESLWCLEKHKDCIVWMERCLCHSVEQYLSAPIHSTSQKEWAETVNYILNYFEVVVEQDEEEFISTLDTYLSRLVQTLAKIVTNQLDTEVTKATQTHLINTRIPWLVLYLIVQREDDLNAAAIKAMPDDIVVLPNALQIFFTAHEFLGRKKWCSKDDCKFLFLILDTVTPRLRSPELETARETVMELLEQVVYCLYKIKPKKQRSKYMAEHDAKSIDLTWERAIQLFDIFRPDTLPEFDSYKLQSISVDMEMLLQKILLQIPKCLDFAPFTCGIKDFINGTAEHLPREINLMPSRIQSIYYLIADFHFKNKDFSTAIRFYILDLTLRPQRFDSWAGLALSKSAKIEAKLNSCDDFNPKEFLEEAAKVMRCYEQCLKLNDKNRVLWIEYGNFTYNLHSFCSRCLKQGNENLSIEYFEFIEARKEQCINIAHNAFTMLAKLAESATKRLKGSENDDMMVDDADEENEENDELWLYYYMLGKIAEKKHEDPQQYLDLYLSSAKSLYENGATYPLKISHSYPTTLSIEALEVFYRINAAIIKYLEQHPKVNRSVLKVFNRVLKDLANSPFAINRAKIKNSAIKRKTTAAELETPVNGKRMKTSDALNPDPPQLEQPQPESLTPLPTGLDAEPVKCNGNGIAHHEPSDAPTPPFVTPDSTVTNGTAAPVERRIEQLTRADARRSSHESSVTTTTTTTGSDSSSSSSSSDDSSSSDSDSDGTSESSNLQEVSQAELDAVFKLCIKNLEECVTRFPEHYKSTYRLIYHFLHAKGETKSLQNCKQLLLSTYMTALDSKVTGLFTDRKNNNFFNGLWRNPSAEIDRPGNFAAHLSKCTSILIEVLKQLTEYQVLFELALSLHKTPEADKKYLKETERKELFQQAILFCVQSFRVLLKKHQDAKDDPAILNLLIEIYKIHRKSNKYMQHKESLFSSVLVDVYKAYVENKVTLPENANVLDLAFKLCTHELVQRKQREKAAASTDTVSSTTITTSMSTPPTTPQAAAVQQTTPASSPIYIPGVTKRKSVEKKPKSAPAVDLPKQNAVPIPSQAEITALLMELQRVQPTNAAAAPAQPVLPGLPANPSELQMMLTVMQQQNMLYSQISALATTSTAPNYNQFAMKYIESLATNLLGSLSPQMKGGSATIKPGKLAQSFGTPKTPKSVTPKSSKQPKQQQQQQQQLISAPSTSQYNNLLPFDLPKSTSLEKVQPIQKSSSYDVLGSSTVPKPPVKARSTISVRNDLLQGTPKPKEIPKFDPSAISASFRQSLGVRSDLTTSSTGLSMTTTTPTSSSKPLSRPWLQKPQQASGGGTAKPKRPSKNVMQLPADLPKSLTITPSPSHNIPKTNHKQNAPKISLQPSQPKSHSSNSDARIPASAFLLEYTKNLQLGSAVTIDLTSPKGKASPPARSQKAGTSRDPLTNGGKYSSVSGLNIPSAISVSPVPSNSSVQSLSPIGSSKSYSPLSKTYRPASISPIFPESSPTKTLQEKLAEKKKASQEMTHKATTLMYPTNHKTSTPTPPIPQKTNSKSNKKVNDDVVIVLDD